MNTIIVTTESQLSELITKSVNLEFRRVLSEFKTVPQPQPEPKSNNSKIRAWITGLLTVKYGVNDTNLEVAKEIVDFLYDKNRMKNI